MSSFFEWLRKLWRSFIGDGKFVPTPVPDDVYPGGNVNFKVGDRVRLKENGEYGSVTELHEEYQGYTIEFDGAEEPQSVFYDTDLEAA